MFVISKTWKKLHSTKRKNKLITYPDNEKRSAQANMQINLNKKDASKKYLYE